MLASRDCVEVQDRYVGDLGDYLKLGLLRWLTTGISAPHLGVVWYRTVDEAHNADGKHVAYLRDGHTTARALRPLDPDLYDGLSSIVTSGQRTTAALAEARLLPSGTVYFNDLLHLADCPSPRVQRERSDEGCGWLVRWLRRGAAIWSSLTRTTASARRGTRLDPTGTAPSSTRISTNWQPLRLVVNL